MDKIYSNKHFKAWLTAVLAALLFFALLLPIAPAFAASDVTVKFNVNGGQLDMGSEYYLTQTVPSGTLFSSVIKPVSSKTGYKQTGWATSSSGTTPVSGSLAITSSKTFYAIWVSSAPEMITVTFNPNGGSIVAGSSSVSVQKGTTGSALNKPTLTRPGYSLRGWSLNSTSFQNANSVALNSSITLYAFWTEIEMSYKVTFSANGGQIVSGNSSVTVSDVTSFNSISKPAVTRAHYYFYGWSKSSTEYISAAGSTINGNMTVYAWWQSYAVITCDPNGGTISGDTTFETIPGLPAAVPSTIMATRDGYTFVGWSLNSDWYNPVTPPDGTGVSPTFNGDATVYAFWEADEPVPEEITITCDPNGGVVVSGNTTFKSIKGMSVGFGVPAVSRDGYTFVGWSTDKDTYMAVYPPAGTGLPSQIFNGDATIYAIWKLIPTPAIAIITIDPNGGVLAGETTFEAGVGLPAAVPSTITAMREGFVFRGWSYSNEWYNPVYPVDDTGIQPIFFGDATIYAFWYMPINVNINYYKNGELVDTEMLVGDWMDGYLYEYSGKTISGSTVMNKSYKTVDFKPVKLINFIADKTIDIHNFRSEIGSVENIEIAFADFEFDFETPLTYKIGNSNPAGKSNITVDFYFAGMPELQVKNNVNSDVQIILGLWDDDKGMYYFDLNFSKPYSMPYNSVADVFYPQFKDIKAGMKVGLNVSNLMFEQMYRDNLAPFGSDYFDVTQRLERLDYSLLADWRFDKEFLNVSVKGLRFYANAEDIVAESLTVEFIYTDEVLPGDKDNNKNNSFWVYFGVAAVFVVLIVVIVVIAKRK